MSLPVVSGLRTVDIVHTVAREWRDCPLEIIQHYIEPFLSMDMFMLLELPYEAMDIFRLTDDIVYTMRGRTYSMDIATGTMVDLGTNAMSIIRKRRAQGLSAAARVSICRCESCTLTTFEYDLGICKRRDNDLIDIQYVEDGAIVDECVIRGAEACLDQTNAGRPLISSILTIVTADKNIAVIPRGIDVPTQPPHA